MHSPTFPSLLFALGLDLYERRKMNLLELWTELYGCSHVDSIVLWLPIRHGHEEVLVDQCILIFFHDLCLPHSVILDFFPDYTLTIPRKPNVI